MVLARRTVRNRQIKTAPVQSQNLWGLGTVLNGSLQITVLGRINVGQPYSQRFFDSSSSTSRSSAEAIVPLVIDLVRPRSIIDVGCGLGTWLSVFMDHGIQDVLGVDGAWIDCDRLSIPRKHFLIYELRKHLQLNRRFDLVVSLEVAEHLPESCASTFVDSLVGLGSLVLFSAAIPFQGGTSHLNEQWPDYWARLFAAHGYVLVDCLRGRIWNNPSVGFYYAQNMFLFATLERLQALDATVSNGYEATDGTPRAFVHPELYLQHVDPRNMPLRRALAVVEALPTLSYRATSRRLTYYLKRALSQNPAHKQAGPIQPDYRQHAGPRSAGND